MISMHIPSYSGISDRICSTPRTELAQRLPKPLYSVHLLPILILERAVWRVVASRVDTSLERGLKTNLAWHHCFADRQKGQTHKESMKRLSKVVFCRLWYHASNEIHPEL